MTRKVMEHEQQGNTELVCLLRRVGRELLKGSWPKVRNFYSATIYSVVLAEIQIHAEGRDRGIG